MISCCAMGQGDPSARDRVRELLLLVGVALLLSLVTVFVQVETRGLAYLEGEQWKRHELVLSGAAGSLWQYRILPELLVEGVIRLCKGLPRPIATGFIAFRMLENLLLFVFAGLYYRRLGLRQSWMLLGLGIVGFAM